jgi:ornithine carbamoyltransferase
MSTKSKKSRDHAKKSAKHSASTRVVKPKGPFADKDLLSLKGLNHDDMTQLFKLTDAMKKTPDRFVTALRGKTLGLLFQKPSSRTRVSFEVGMAQLGGQAIYLSDQEIQMGTREPIRDVARTLAGYFNGIVLRTHAHATAEEFAKFSSVPVINGLSDIEHPCQILSDFYTIYAKYGKLKGINITYIGDSNNVLISMLYGAAICGANLSIVTPRGYEPTEELMKDIKVLSKDSGAKFAMSNSPFASLKNAHVIYTDVWVSMGQERQKEQRLRDFQSFQVNQTIVSKALPDALVMHCLPAHRGEEITDEVIEGPLSIVFEQAHNKMHVQKALLSFLLNKKKKR